MLSSTELLMHRRKFLISIESLHATTGENGIDGYLYGH